MKPSDYEVLDRLIKNHGIVNNSVNSWNTDLLRVISDRTYLNTTDFLRISFLDIQYWPKNSLSLLLSDIGTFLVRDLIPELDIRSSYVEYIVFSKIPTKLKLYESEIGSLGPSLTTLDSGIYDNELKTVDVIKSIVHHLSLVKTSIQLFVGRDSIIETLYANDSRFENGKIGMCSNGFSWHFKNCSFSNVAFGDISNLGEVTFENCTFEKPCRVQIRDQRTHKKSGKALKETLVRYGYKISPDCFFL